MNKLEISEIQIIPIKPKDGLVAFVSCVINSQFYLGNIGVYTSPSASDGYRLTFPIKTLANGKQINCVHPITREAGEAIKKAIIDKYEELISKFKVS